MSPKAIFTARSGGATILTLIALAACSRSAPATVSQPLAGPQSASACTVPHTEAIYQKNVTFDLCLEQSFTQGGVTYTIHIYYTLTSSPGNLAQCTAAENAQSRCEHKPPDANSISKLAADLEAAIRFNAQRNLAVLPAGQPLLVVYIAEAPVVYAWTGKDNPRVMIWDDEQLRYDISAFILANRRIAFHEAHHLAQFQYNDLAGADPFFGEGIARAIEDRVEPALDTQPKSQFHQQIEEMLTVDAKRTADLATLSYASAAWWTWLMDHYRLGSEVEPVTGWAALRDYYIQLSGESSSLIALHKFLAAKGSTFQKDFIDYTLALYAHKYNPSDARLTFLDAEIRTDTLPLAGHNVFSNGPAFGAQTVAMNIRSSRYWEFVPANQCQYVAFTFDGHGELHGYSVMTVDGGVLQDRWTSFGPSWARLVRSADLERVVGVVTSTQATGPVTVGRGCVTPSLSIKDPTAGKFKLLGPADNPRNFIVRLTLESAGQPLPGALAGYFQVKLRQTGTNAAPLAAKVINAAYVQDNYWLLVQPPKAAQGAQTGQSYDLIVSFDNNLSDTELGAVRYSGGVQDVMIVLDRSGSMLNSGKITAAANAASLLVNELADADRAGLVGFSSDAELREPLAQVGVGPSSHRFDLEWSIITVFADGFTSIGDALLTAAAEHDANGVPANACSFVLLSDGHENEPAYWSNVQAAVTDNGCALHTIALGPEANEILMQQIAGAAPGGSYDYADSSGSVPLAWTPGGPLVARLGRPAQAAAVSWQNNLSRVYDYKATQLAGRQRVQTWAETGHGEFPIYVDDLADQLVVVLAWQNPAAGPVEVQLYAPNGAPAQAVRRVASGGANEVWEVADPIPGEWLFVVESSQEEYVVSASVLSDYELYLFAGAPLQNLTQGVKVPILAALVGGGAPLTGASVTASVRAPNGQVQSLLLHDDGNHLDGEADDGVYGGLYTATSLADPEAPPNPVEGQEPKAAGSYQVTAVSLWNNIRREAQTSFAIAPGPDEDGDGLPDEWEALYGVDDPTADDDGDGLDNECEYTLGTDPQNSDTDGGGQGDGSEAPECNLALQDPFEPEDDLVGQVALVKATPESDGQPYVLIQWSPPLSGNLAYVRLWRRLTPPGGPPEAWTEIAPDVRGQQYEDRGVRDGFAYEYRLIPYITPPVASAGAALQTEVMGAAVETGAVTALADPYSPIGTILIDDGAATTADLLVTLSLSASDSFDLPAGAPSTATDQLEMQISNSPDFAGTQWIPFQAAVQDWTIGPADPGDIVTIYVQFKDAAGNVGGGPNAFASILYQPGTFLYLPFIQR